MRVIAGRFRGRSLTAPHGHTTRPITDRAKESLFNVLGGRFGEPGSLPDLDVLDLFAGSGALGIEALSRGARSGLFVEKDRAALSALRQNVAALKLSQEARIIAENAWTLPIRPPTAQGFGLVFVDPPYREVTQTERVDALLMTLSRNVAEDGLIVLRHGIETSYSPCGLQTLQCVDERRFGSMRILLLARPNRPQNPPAAVE